MARVLVVEDDDMIARIVRIKLENAGHEVLIAGDGAEGLKAIHDHLPDLVLLDVMMPIMDGYQVLRTLRSNPALASLPVIMLTAKGQEREISSGLKEGATDYIVKPFSPSEVVNRVEHALGKVSGKDDPIR